VFPDESELDSYVPTQTGWTPYAGYGAGRLDGRNYGLQTSSNLSCRWYSKTLSRLTFSTADGKLRYVGPEDSGSQHGDFDTSFRENRPKTSQQLSFNKKLSFGAADIDIDEECPYCGSAGSTAKHAGRVVIHKVFGGKTNPYDIYNRLTTQRAIQPSYTVKK
jgi:hypothetical protein